MTSQEQIPDTTLQLWDIYPALWQDTTPYVDPWEDVSLLEQLKDESFRLSMLDRKREFDDLYKQLQVRVHHVVIPEVSKNFEDQAVFDLLQVYLGLN